MSAGPEHDSLLQGTCQAIVDVVGEAVGGEPAGGVVPVNMHDGQIIGKQITIDASEKEGKLNLCRLSMLDSAVAPEAELVRMEYEDEREGKSGKHQVYSVQRVRQVGRELRLEENFLAESAMQVRDEDFRPITSDQYAQKTVLATVVEWAHFRAWQIQESGRK
jgi:hypothetical protein